MPCNAKKSTQQVEQEYTITTCFPPKELIFSAFEQFDFQDTKVVIIGQDPYHGIGEANGLCFSVNDGVAIPPSLKNIYTEINNEYDRFLFPTSGNLERWAKQGVLLLNAALTVQKDKPNSHKHLNWNQFTDAVIQLISDNKEKASKLDSSLQSLSKTYNLTFESNNNYYNNIHTQINFSSKENFGTFFHNVISKVYSDFSTGSGSGFSSSSP